MFSVGEFSRIGQVSKRLLRYYDEIGLLKPVRIEVDSQRQIQFYVRWYINRKLGNVFADHSAQEQLMQSSSLPHLILRPTYLTYAAGAGRVNVSTANERADVRAAVARADVAAFALEAIERGNHRGALTAAS